MEALVLFDIDGTLLRRAGPHHRQALVEAVRRATGLEATTEGIPVQGMLDRDILTAMLVAAGASRGLIRGKMAEMVAIAQSIYVRRCPDLRRKVCPGARMLLYRLARRRVPVGLVSGNLTRIGWKKMERAGLRRYLRFGAFAERAKDRAGLVRIAIRYAREQGWIGRGSPVTLIGDHPNDIRAARENGVRAIAVATGLASVEDLAAHTPDLLVADLRAVSVEMLVDGADFALQPRSRRSLKLPLLSTPHALQKPTTQVLESVRVHRLKPVPPCCASQLGGFLILMTAPAVYAEACSTWVRQR